MEIGDTVTAARENVDVSDSERLEMKMAGMTGACSERDTVL